MSKLLAGVLLAILFTSGGCSRGIRGRWGSFGTTDTSLRSLNILLPQRRKMMPDLRPSYPTVEELWKNPILRIALIAGAIAIAIKVISWILG